MIQSMQTSKDQLIGELKLAGAVFKGAAMHCLYPQNHKHGDRHPSAGIYCKDGVYRWHCQSCGTGGDVFDVISLRTGRPLADILNENTQDAFTMKTIDRPKPQAEKTTFADLNAIYDYMGKFGGHLDALHRYTEDFSIIRWLDQSGKKRIRPVLRTEAGLVLEFPQQRVLYRLPSLSQARTVVICEGEKKADILAGYGFAATTSSGGSQAASKTDWKPLAGRECIIWPDADSPGRQYAADVLRILEGLSPAAQVRIIDPASLDLQDGEDAADYIRQLQVLEYDDSQIKENLIGVFAKAKSTGAGTEVRQHISGIVSGKYEPLETGFGCLDDVMQILPGSLNLVCGSPGSSKSLFMLQLAAGWYMAGIKCAILELEKDRTFHMRRSLAQASGLAMMTNNRWVLENADLAQRTAAQHIEFMDGFGRLINAMPDKMIYQKDVCDWVEQKAIAGCRAVIIDPATKAERQAEAWKADSQFVQRLQQIATQTRLIIFLVLHPSKSLIAMPDLSCIAGGASYGRFADNAIWLEHHESKMSKIKTACGTVEAEHDRTIWILKSRDGSGTNTRIAFEFNKTNLTLNELGIIVKKGKKTEC
jgi:hypothetical protein